MENKQILAYINNQLSQAEKLAFEAALKADAKLQQEYALTKAELLAFEALEEIETESQVDKWLDEVAEKTTSAPIQTQTEPKVIPLQPTRSLSWVKYAVAAALIGFVVWLVIPNAPDNKQIAWELANDQNNWKDVAMLSEVRDITTNPDEIKKLLNEKQYALALEKLETIPIPSKDGQIEFLKMQLYYELKQFDKVESIYTTIQNASIPNEQKENAQFLALRYYLSQNKLTEFKALSASILQNTNHRFYSKVKTLSEKIK